MNNSIDAKIPILIVDDDLTLICTLKSELSLKGYHCETATNAALAMELIYKTSFDVMITDIVLPDMGGFKLTEKVKGLKPNMAVIIMTDLINDFSYGDAIKSGASDFIKKPFTLKELTARIEYAKSHEKMHSLLLTDELTGLYNRRGFFTLGEYQLKIAKRQPSGIYMLYADLDNLKGINDTWGHQAGDIALFAIANILKNNYRQSDVIARIGGDEFVVIPGGNANDDIEKIIERLHDAIKIHNLQSNRNYQLSISAGLAFFDPANPCSLDELLAQGDKSMYERKRNKQGSQLMLLS